MIRNTGLRALGAAVAAIAAMALLTLAPLFAPAQAQAQKRIYIGPDDHTDYMWAADEATYRQAFLDMLDYYLNLADTTANNPAPYQSRWNCDGNFWLWTYEKNKSQAAFDRLMARVRDGHISAPLTTLVGCYGGAPAEAILRGLYYPGHLERRYNLRFPLAVAMENQTLPFGLGSLWAGAGAKWSWRGICDCVTRTPNAGVREHEIYYWTGADGSKVLMKWNSLLTDNKSIGGYAEAYNPADTVNLVDTNAVFLARYPYPVIGAFGKGWDGVETLTDEFVTTAQNTTNANRQVIVSNEQDFFQDFEAGYGAGLPTVSATFGNEWDLYCASLAEVSAGVKRSLEKLRAGEALATLVSLKTPGFMDGRTDARDQAWVNFGLYWEHDWTGDGPAVNRQQRADWQRRVASGIAAYVDPLYSDAATALGGLIAKSGTNARFYAFNPLGWTRTDAADFPYTDTNPVHALDVVTGLETPSQLVTVDGARYLRVLASDVPALGYKVFEIVPGAGQNYSPVATVTGGVMDGSDYRLTVSNWGAITSLKDKARGNREFARQVNGRWINDLESSGGTLAIENAGPVSVTLVATAKGATVPLDHITRVTLTRGLKRIAIRNDIQENFGDVRTCGFGFNLDSPDVWTEEVGAVIRAKLLANGGHYSPRNARYDWISANHFTDMSGTGNVGVTLSNADNYFLQLGNSAVGNLDTATPQLQMLVGGQVDGTSLGIPNQGGDSQFLQRYALTTHDAFDAPTAMRFALEHQNPLVTGAVSGASNGGSYPAATYSLLTTSNPNALIWAVKPAEEGIQAGVIARVWNLSASPLNYTLDFAGPLAGAKQTTHIETDLSDATVNGSSVAVSANARQLQTFRLRPAPALKGVVTLEGALDLAQPVTFTFRPKPSGTAFSLTTTLDASGAYLLSGLPPGTYNVLIKSPKNLAQLTTNVDLSSNASVRTVSVTLPGGDANDDNSVDNLDLGLVALAYATTTGDPAFDPRADFNNDGSVDNLDLAVLANNYALTGDN